MWRSRVWVFGLTLVAVLPATSQAHFFWLVGGNDAQGPRVEFRFSEQGEPGEPDLLEKLPELTIWQANAGTPARETPLATTAGERVCRLGDSPTLSWLAHDYGVITRGGETFLLRYLAQTGPAGEAALWEQVRTTRKLDLELLPTWKDGSLTVRVLWRAEPDAGATVIVIDPQGDAQEQVADEQGRIDVPDAATAAGRYAFRVRHVEAQAGDWKRTPYDSIRTYATLTLDLEVPPAAAPTAQPTAAMFPDLPRAATSFGAARVGQSIYAYGGHSGHTHAYSEQEQNGELWRLDLDQPDSWRPVGSGPRLQGLALVAHKGAVIRVGGVSALNQPDEESHMVSVAEVARFEEASESWSAFTPLPEPRSSHDAALLENVLYVVGGWNLQGETPPTWHSTAWRLDLASARGIWQPLAQLPVSRRALTVAAHAERIYALGGMRETGGPCTRVDVYDPATDAWSPGPELPGDPLAGFGCAAVEVVGVLWVSTIRGGLWRLSPAGDAWESVEADIPGRFFHRLVSIGERGLLAIGGTDLNQQALADVRVWRLPVDSTR